MFSGTIADNMRNVKPDATDEEIIEAMKQCLRLGLCGKAAGRHLQ